MTRHDPLLPLRQMIDHAREAVELAAGRTREDLSSDRALELSLTRLLEIVGEAARRASREARERNPEIAWSEIIGMRNRLIHGYDSVDLDVVWGVVQTDLPTLLAQLRAALPDAASPEEAG